MLRRHIGDITPTDVQKLVDERRPEAFDLEFKATIPTENGEPDRWITQGDRVGRWGRDQILREVVAFANAQGGTLILGVDENDTPGRAAKLTPVSRCQELAERLAATMRDNIEPRLAFSECRGVPTSAAGSGVVIIRVPPSRQGPHWVASSREATIRRGAHSVSMTMTGIQNLTLKLSRDVDAIEDEFDRRAKMFSSRFAKDRGLLQEMYERRLTGTNLNARAIGLSVTALPLAPITIPRVITDLSLRLNPAVLKGIAKIDGHEINQPEFVQGAVWRPVLRGVRLDETTRDHVHYREIAENGAIEFGWIYAIHGDPNSPRGFPLDQVLWSVAFVLVWIELSRAKHGFPDLPFGLAINLHCGDVNFLPAPSSRVFAYFYRNFFPMSVTFPRYRVADRTEFRPLLGQISHDFFNAGGSEFKASLEVAFEAVLALIDE
jgi:hypothetical protein